MSTDNTIPSQVVVPLPDVDVSRDGFDSLYALLDYYADETAPPVEKSAEAIAHGLLDIAKSLRVLSGRGDEAP